MLSMNSILISINSIGTCNSINHIGMLYKFAKAAGEVEYIRTDHTSGSSFQATSPVSNVPVNPMNKRGKK